MLDQTAIQLSGLHVSFLGLSITVPAQLALALAKNQNVNSSNNFRTKEAN